MSTIYVKTTDTCNLNCKHCFTGGRIQTDTVWDWVETQKWVLDYVTKHGADHHIELHGGEPFLVSLDTLESFVKPFIKMGLSVGATTNLVYRLTPRHIQFFHESLGSRVGTSWDGDIRFSNDKQKELWLKNVKRLHTEGIKVKLFVSVTRGLVETGVDEFLDFLSTLGVSEVSLERLTVDGNAKVNDEIFPSNEDQDNWYLALYKRYVGRTWNYSINTLDTITEKVKSNLVKVDTNCRNCEQNLVTISADGTLSGCPNGAMSEKMGDVWLGVDAFIKNGQRLTNIAEELDFTETCITCNVFDMCGGDCHRLPWKEGRCGGLKNLLRYLKFGDQRIPAIQVQ